MVLTPRERLAAALRATIGFCGAPQLGDDELRHALVAMENLHFSRSGPEMDATMSGGVQLRAPSEVTSLTNPFTGTVNPLAPPLHLSIVTGKGDEPSQILGLVTFGYLYEGVPTCVHGGVVAGTCHELLEAARTIAGRSGDMTLMSVRFHKPTPSHKELRLLAYVLRRDGLGMVVWAGLYHGDVLTAEAEGHFIESRTRLFADESSLRDNQGWLTGSL